MANKAETIATIQRLIGLTDQGRCDWQETSQLGQYKLSIGTSSFYISKSRKLINSYDVEIQDYYENTITKELYENKNNSSDAEHLYEAIARFMHRKYQKQMKEISDKLDALEKSGIVIA